MKSRTFPQWITALSFLLITSTAYAQSPTDFDGQWGGYITVKDKPAFFVVLKFKSYEKKTVAASYNIYPYGGDTSTLIEKKQLVFDYDKQKNMVYANTDWPAPGGGHCTGYLVVDMDKKDHSKVSARFQLNKSCMDAVVVLNKQEYLYGDPIYQGHFAILKDVKNKTPDNKPNLSETKVASNSETKVASNSEKSVDNKSEKMEPAKASTPQATTPIITKTITDTTVASIINPKDVTHPADKEFKWVEWKKAPEALKNATRNIHMYTDNKTQKDVLLCDKIKEYLEDTVAGTIPAYVQIAAIDLNNDGIYGIAVSVSGSMWCGTAGCTFELYENGGLLTVNLGTDYGPNPASNGVKASNGRFFPLVANNRINVDTKEITTLFTYDKAKQKNALQREVETGNGTLPKLTPPTAASKQFLFKRWKVVEMIGSDHQGFANRTKNGETSEMQFGRDNKCYMYKDGILGFAIPFILAPDGKSVLLTQPNSSERMSLQILSLTASQMIIKGVFFDNNIVVFKAK